MKTTYYMRVDISDKKKKKHNKSSCILHKIGETVKKLKQILQDA